MLVSGPQARALAWAASQTVPIPWMLTVIFDGSTTVVDFIVELSFGTRILIVHAGAIVSLIGPLAVNSIDGANERAGQPVAWYGTLLVASAPVYGVIVLTMLNGEHEDALNRNGLPVEAATPGMSMRSSWMCVGTPLNNCGIASKSTVMPWSFGRTMIRPWVM